MNDSKANEQVNFGHERVSVEEQVQRVRNVFAKVAPRYDLMNDLMSLGMHRLMKRLVIEYSGVRAHSRVLDLAGGTGDLTQRFAEVVDLQPNSERPGQLVLCDINEAMLTEGRDRLLDAGLAQVQFVQANAEQLPFADNSFDVLSIAFGLRNVARKELALAQMYRVLAPGGRLLILEFSRVQQPLLRDLYNAWQSLWPRFGKVLVGDEAPYRYLVDSIATHPPQDELLAMMQRVGFTNARYENLLDGVVALHRAQKNSSAEIVAGSP